MMQNSAGAVLDDTERFTPGPHVLRHVLAHLWSRTSGWQRVAAVGFLVAGMARVAGLT